MNKYLRAIYAVAKISIAQIYVATFGKKYLQQNIWLVGDKKTEARDNGYHFFKYLRSEHPEINSVFAIRPGSADETIAKTIGPVIPYDSFIHCIYYAAAKVRACSQNHGVRPFEDIPGIKRIRLFMRNDQRHINLKHGISKDFLPGSFDFRKVGFDLYIAGAKPEYDAIKEQFNYPDKNIALTGFCRFDALYNLPKPEKSILIMPTFRSWLRTSDSSKSEASEDEMQTFLNSKYYKAYKSLLTDPSILEKAKEKGYNILFYLHYTFQPYVKAFEPFANDVVTVCKRSEYDIQKLLTSSSMLITDYSSVFFDYGYMKKPMLFYQFDIDEYRDKHYKEGYFSYERDAFGPIVKNCNEVVNYMLHIIDQDMQMDEEYKNRTEKFFIPHDNHNCQRVYEAILRLDEE